MNRSEAELGDARSDVSIVAAVERFLRSDGVVGERDALECERLSGGRSHVTMRVRVVAESSDQVLRDLVVKWAGPDGPLAPYDVAHEARALQYAGSIGVPVPALVGCEPAADGNGGIVVMEYASGEAPGLGDLARWLERRDENVRINLGRQLVASLRPAVASRPPWFGGSSLGEHYETYLRGHCERLIEAARGVFEVPRSVTDVADWLIRRVSAVIGDGDQSLTHGDFRIGNVLLSSDGGVVAVVDWERAMAGHPYHDIGYLCLPGMRIRGLIGGVYTEPELEAAWRAERGVRFERDVCAFFRIIAMFTELCTMLRALLRADAMTVLRQSRSLPLVVTIQRDLLEAVDGWERNEPSL